MTDWPAECARMEAEVCGDIEGPDYADKPVIAWPPIWALIVMFAANVVLWVLIGLGVWELARL